MTDRRASGDRATQTVRSSTLLGAAVPAGWVLYDATKYAPSLTPLAFLELVPGSLFAVGLGAVFGWLAGRARWALPACLAASAAVAVVVPLLELSTELRFSMNQTWLPRVVFLLATGFALGSLRLLRRLGSLRAGLALGFLLCHGVTYYRHGPSPWVLPEVAAGAALAVLLAGFVRPAWLRRVVTAALLAYPIFLAGNAALGRLRNDRPDLSPPSAAAPDGAPNLMLIVMDTVRADRLAPYGYHRVTTPRIDAFCREHTTRYTQARSTGPYTLPSHASLFTGLFSADHGADHPRLPSQETSPRDRRSPAVPLRPDVPTLAERLRATGYSTVAIVANNAYLHHSFGLDRGFEHYDDADGCNMGGYRALAQFGGWLPRLGVMRYREGGAITDGALTWLRERDPERPFFLMLNYMDAHSPYVPPAAYRGAFGDAQPVEPTRPKREFRSLLYDRSLLALDDHLGRLLDEVVASGLLENTVVLITSDHGEAFGDHDFWMHAWTVYEEQVHVPFYFKPLGPRAREVDDTLISGMQVPHLLLRELGFESGPLPETGGVVSEWYHSKPVFRAEEWGRITDHDIGADLLAYVDDGRKFIVGSDGSVEAFDLAQDPGETTALTLTEDEVAASLARARAWWSDHPPLEPLDSSEEGIDEDTLDRLRGLGYLGE